MIRLLIVECRRALARGVTRMLLGLAVVGIAITGVSVLVTTKSADELRSAELARRSERAAAADSSIQSCMARMQAQYPPSRATPTTSTPASPSSTTGSTATTPDKPGITAVPVPDTGDGGYVDQWGPVYDGTASPELLRKYCEGQSGLGYSSYYYSQGRVFAFAALWIAEPDPEPEPGDGSGIGEDDGFGGSSGSSGSGRSSGSTGTTTGTISPSGGNATSATDPSAEPTFATTASRGRNSDSILLTPATLLFIGALIASASLMGAEWQTGSLVMFLTWEPRRVRVLLAKVLASAALAGLISFALLLLFSAALYPTAALKGTTEGMDGAWWGATLSAMARISMVTALAATLGSSLAMIGRRTAVAIGIVFLYLAVAESLVGAWQEGWRAWLLGYNAVAFLTDLTLRGDTFARTPTEAGLILVVYAALFTTLAALAFRRRDFASG